MTVVAVLSDFGIEFEVFNGIPQPSTNSLHQKYIGAPMLMHTRDSPTRQECLHGNEFRRSSSWSIEQAQPTSSCLEAPYAYTACRRLTLQRASSEKKKKKLPGTKQELADSQMYSTKPPYGVAYLLRLSRVPTSATAVAAGETMTICFSDICK
jgi:hypothetical protein